MSEELSSKELLEAQSHLWNEMFAYMRSLSLKCAVELGIADAVYSNGKPISIADLATALSVPACRVEHLRRLMSLLVHTGFFERTLAPGTNQQVYSLTNNSKVLIKKPGATVAPVIEAACREELFDAWQSLSGWFKSEQPSTAFEARHGMYVWHATKEIPEFGNALNKCFDSDSEIAAKVMLETCPDQFEGVKSLVDVAGNSGKIAQAVAKAFPQIKCTVLDLPHVIDSVEKSSTVEYVAGDMFKSIPPADMLVLKWVLMMWSDEECVKILKNCKNAIPTKEKGGKAIIIDKVIDARVEVMHPKLPETQLFFDMQMLVHTTGKQRTESEWKKIITEAGFKEYKIIPTLGLRSIIEIYH